MKRHCIIFAAAIMMIACVESSAHAANPSVVSVSPAQNAVGVSREASILVYFETQLDSTTIHDSTVLVTGSQSGRLRGMVTYDNSSQRLTFNPRYDFALGEEIRVVLTTGVKSSTGDSLQNGYAWSFSVKTYPGPSAFAPQIGYGAGERAYFVEACDMDGDFDIDIVGADFFGGRVYVLANDGTGSFFMYSDCELGGETICFTVDDFDNDGDQDIAAVSQTSQFIAIVHNNGTGTLSLDTIFTSSEKARWIEAADFDNDGDLDLVTANYSPPDNISIYTNNGGVFEHSANYPSGDVVYSVCTPDLDNDGDADIASVNVRDDNVSIYINDGTGLFSPAVHYTVGPDPYYVGSGDFDGDGFLDLAATNSTSDDISILHNNGDATFTELYRLDAGEPLFIKSLDIDGDGDVDLVGGNYAYYGINLFINDGSGAFDMTEFPWIGGYHTAITHADFDNDTDIDLAVSQRLADDIGVVFNQTAIIAFPTSFDLISSVIGWPDPEDYHFEVLCNAGAASFDILESAEWFSVSPTSGVTPCTVSISFDLSVLADGEYSDTIVVSSEDVENESVSVYLGISVYPEGTLPPDFVRIAVDSIAAGTLDAELPFYVQRLCPEPVRIMGHSNGFVLDATGGVSWEYAGYDPGPMLFWFNLGAGLLTKFFDGTPPDSFLVGSAGMPPSGMPVTEETFFFSIFLDFGPGTGELLIDSAFVGAAGAWKFSGLTCGWGGAPDKPLLLANDYTNLNHPIRIKIYEPICGDANLDGIVDIDDIVFLVAYIFQGGTPPNPMKPADVDCSGNVDVDDAVYLLYYVFLGTTPPCDTDGDGTPDC